MLVSPALYTYAQTAPARKPDPALVTFALRWIRQNPAATPGTSAPDPVLIAQPILTTTDGQVASLEFKSDPKSGTNDTFFVSLSPTVEPTDNKSKSIDGQDIAKSGPTVRALWTLRITGNSLPAGMTSIAASGSARLTLGEKTDAVVARLLLADPKTGMLTEYRLVGRTTLGDSPKIETGNSVTSPVPAPY